MRRLLRFFVLMTLRVIAVSTVILWGTSKVSHVRAMAPIGSTAASLQAYSDGICLAVFFAPNSTLQFDVRHGNNMSLAENFQNSPVSSCPPFWFLREPSGTLIAGPYWLVLFLSVLLYAVIELQGRRRKSRSAAENRT